MRKIIGYICMVMVSGSLVSPIMADGHPPPPPEGMMPEDGMMHHPDGMVPKDGMMHGPDGMMPKDGMMHGPNGIMMHEEGMPMMMGERPPECDAAEAVIKEAGIDPGAFAEFTFKQFGSMDMPPPPDGMMPEDGMMHHPDGMVPKDGMMHGPDGMMPKDGMMHGPNGMMMHEKGMPMMGERPPECDAAEAVIKEAGIDPGAFAEFTFKQFGSMDMPPPPEGMMPEDGMMHHPDGMGPKDGMMHGPDGMMPKDGMMHGPDGMMDDKLDIAVAEEFFGGDIEAAAGMFQQLDKFGVRPEDCGYFPPGPPM